MATRTTPLWAWGWVEVAFTHRDVQDAFMEVLFALIHLVVVCARAATPWSVPGLTEVTDELT